MDMLATRHPGHRFVVVGRERRRSQRRANLSRYVAAQWGCFPEVVGEETDLMDVDRTAELIDRYQPDVLFNATTPFPWWKLEDLPEGQRSLANEAGPGTWCALDCVLPMKLTEALALSCSRAVHVNGCYPDMTNAFLSGQPSAPTIGVGNISNLVPGLQLAFAEELRVTPSQVEIRLVGHHYISYNAPTDRGCPDAAYELSVSHPGGHVRFSGPDDTPFAMLRRHVSRVRNLEGLGVTIGSVATVLDELLGGESRLHHCPGAKGLPGGYPVRFSPTGEPIFDLPYGVDEPQARTANERAQPLDGVLRVEPGRVDPTPLAKTAYAEIVGTELPDVTQGSVVEISRDAVARLERRYRLGLVPL